MKKYLLILSLFLTPVAHAACYGDQSATPVRKVYIVPQLSSSQLYSSWAPVLEKIGNDTHQCLELVVTRSIPEFELAVQSGEADYAFMNPYHMVMARKKYVPLIADGDKMLDGIIVVRKDSPIQNISQLNNKKMAFPAPNAFAASLLIRSILSNKNINITSEYVGTHPNVYRSVVLGDVVAGGGVNFTFDREPTAIKDKLRVLYQTREYTPHPFTANTRIPKSTRDAVVDSFIDLSITDYGRQKLSAIQITRPVKVYYDADYLPLESLGLEKFVQNGSN